MQAGQPLSEHARRAERAYGAAADHYDRATLSFWDRYGTATVARLPLAAGDAVSLSGRKLQVLQPDDLVPLGRL